ncbi:MAG TPA: hypothetical protein DCL48_08510, partial [Alphaproteobacteria bacterium]|nr:hypothetical protein [Alphaproteobacteria bacterium]
MKTYDKFYIDGAWVDPAPPHRFEEVINPATEEAFAKVALGNKADVDRAVEAAHRALTTGEWPKCNATKRGALLRKLGDLITEHCKSLAETEVRDNGK